MIPRPPGVARGWVPESVRQPSRVGLWQQHPPRINAPPSSGGAGAPEEIAQRLRRCSRTTSGTILSSSFAVILLFPLDVAPPVHKCELIKQGPPSRQPQCCKRKQLLRCPSPSSPKTATYPSSPRAVPSPTAPELKPHHRSPPPRHHYIPPCQGYSTRGSPVPGLKSDLRTAHPHHHGIVPASRPPSTTYPYIEKGGRPRPRASH